MPPTKSKRNNLRFADVIDEFNNSSTNDFMTRFTMLKERIESHNPSIDDLELRWVDEIIEKMSNDYEPTKNDLLIGNMYWKKWKKY